MRHGKLAFNSLVGLLDAGFDLGLDQSSGLDIPSVKTAINGSESFVSQLDFVAPEIPCASNIPSYPNSDRYWSINFQKNFSWQEQKIFDP